MGLVTALPAQATIYTWTDAQGVRHYSDIARPGARTVQLKRMPNGGASASSASAGSGATPGGDARALNLVSPAQGQVFTSRQGQVPVSVVVGNNDHKAGLGDGESLRYKLDGKPVGSGPTRHTRLTLSNVAAGPHTFRVTLLYRGHAVQHSDAVTFRVERSTHAPPPQSTPDTGNRRPPS